MALHAIVKLPSRDLSPAVTPILTSKRLLKHTSYVSPQSLGSYGRRTGINLRRAAIRQRSIEAINSLHLRRDADDYPLSMSKIVKMLSTEEDDAVLLVILRTLRRLLEVSFL